MLFNSLVKSSLGREDVAKMEKENMANSHEIRQTFRNASKAHDSYLYRTSVELIAAICLTCFFAFFSGIRGLGEVSFRFVIIFHFLYKSIPVDIHSENHKKVYIDTLTQ